MDVKSRFLLYQESLSSSGFLLFPEVGSHVSVSSPVSGNFTAPNLHWGVFFDVPLPQFFPFSVLCPFSNLFFPPGSSLGLFHGSLWVHGLPDGLRSFFWVILSFSNISWLVLFSFHNVFVILHKPHFKCDIRKGKTVVRDWSPWQPYLDMVVIDSILNRFYYENVEWMAYTWWKNPNSY